MISNRWMRRLIALFILFAVFLISSRFSRWSVLTNNLLSAHAESKEDELKKNMEFLLKGNFIVNLRIEESEQDLKVLEDLYERYASSVEVECGKSERIGHTKDGGWSVCQHGVFKLPPPCSCQPPCLCKPACLVYSFGINDDWSFDNTIVNSFNCQLRAFDPSLNESSGMRGTRMDFVREGLSGSKHISLDQHLWEMDTLENFLERFNDTDTVIDYLKIDVEYWEWESLQTALKQGALKNVKQLGVEVHRDELWSQSTPISHYRQFLRLFEGLRQAGFYKWSSHLNPLSFTVYSIHSGRMVACCHEFIFLNLHFETSQPSL